MPEMRLSSAPLPDVLPGDGPPTILLVDDDDQIRMLLYIQLEKFGYRVLSMSNGRDALLACRQYTNSIALLLTDVQMPYMSGVELAAQAALCRPEMSVLLSSGSCLSPDEQALADCYGWTFMAKPFHFAEFQRTVGTLMARATQSHLPAPVYRNITPGSLLRQ